MKKYLIIAISVLLMAGIIWWLVFRRAGLYEVTQGIPANAVFVAKTSSFNSIHEKLRKNEIWESLKAYPCFETYHADLNAADSICNAHPALKRLLTDRPFAVSCHGVAAGYDFLYICDLGKLNVVQAVEGILPSFMKDGKLKMSRKGDVTEVVVDNVRLYYAICGNLLLASLSEELVNRSLETCASGNTGKGKEMKGDVLLELNHPELDEWMTAMFSDSGDGKENKYKLRTTAMALDISDNALVFNGETMLDTSRFSFLNALNMMSGARSDVGNILGESTAAYVSLCFSSYPELQEILLGNYRTYNPADYAEYEGMLNRLNKFLGVNVGELFTSWIGTEIAVIRPAVADERRMDDIVLAVRSKDIDLAKDQMGYLVEQIGRRTPLKFKATEYSGHTIHYMSLNGFFRMFLGSLFKKFDHPYFTYLDDYVVFSNSPETLAAMIKDYSLGNTLAKNEKYSGLMGNLGSDNSVYSYACSPETYKYLYAFLKPEKRSEFVRNKGAFQSFETIGLALKNAREGFHTRVLANYNRRAPEEYQLLELSRQLEDMADKVESGRFRPAIPDSISVSTRGDYGYHTDDFGFAGKLSNGDPDGIWTVADRQGKMVGQLLFREGILQGESRYFYPDGALQAQVAYRDGNIETYKEFFADGTLRAEIGYNKGVRHGDALFYYSTGHLRCEGRYKKGCRAGTWKYMKVTGETDHKVKY